MNDETIKSITRKAQVWEVEDLRLRMEAERIKSELAVMYLEKLEQEIERFVEGLAKTVETWDTILKERVR